MIGAALALGLTFQAFAGPCPADAVAQGVSAANRVELAYGSDRNAEFDVAREELVWLVGCFERPVNTEEAPQIHRAMGLIAFSDGDRASARRSWAAVRHHEPYWIPTFTLTHSQDAIAAVWKESEAYDPSYDPLPDIAPATWTVDGAPLAAAPSDRAFILQAFDGHLRGRYSAYLTTTAGAPADVKDPGPPPWAVMTTAAGGGVLVAGTAIALANLAQGNRLVDQANAATTTAAYEAALARRSAAEAGLTAGLVTTGTGVALVGVGVVGVLGGRR